MGVAARSAHQRASTAHTVHASCWRPRSAYEGDERELSELRSQRTAGLRRIVGMPELRPYLRQHPRDGRRGMYADRVDGVSRKPNPPRTRTPVPHAMDPARAQAAAAFLARQEITTTDCRRCGTQISGIRGRYSCGACGWTNPWDEGQGTLLTAEDDPDWPGPEESS